jgi:DNA topoisomerase-1
VLHEKAELIRNRVIATFRDGAIQVLNGRYGPYITDGTKNARIPKDREPSALTEQECADLLAAAPVKTGRGRFGRGAKSAPAKTADAAPVKAAAKKSAAKKAPAKKTAKKTAAKKAPVKKAAAKKTGQAEPTGA